VITVTSENFASWRLAARALLGEDVPPDEVVWSTERMLFPWAAPLSNQSGHVTVPREFLKLAETVALHSDAHRWHLLYRMLYRITHGEPSLWLVEIDEEVRRLHLMAKAVTRDIHKMKAFVRFRRVKDSSPEHFVAWYTSDHNILNAVAPWFRDRFGAMHWSILTPHGSVHWDLQSLVFGPGISRCDAPRHDVLEGLWRDYYSSIFNPARVKVKAMKAEMPVRFWGMLPETELIPTLLQKADVRVTQMIKQQKTSAAPWVPQTGNLGELRKAAAGCRGCALYEHATQVVFGEGPKNANVVMVGETPGNDEDLAGHPFVGPAGKLLDRAMTEAGIDRTKVYVTNAVKHFKFTERGKRRIHAKPSGTEISACRPWLEAELTAIHPDLIVCLGATAAQTLMGRDFRITAQRGIFFPHRLAKELVATIHPSAILRAEDRQEQEYKLFVKDLHTIAARIRELQLAS